MATTHLQGIGEHYAVTAKELKPGMIIMWNYGYTSTVLAVKMSSTGKSLEVQTETDHGTFTRRMKADTLVAVEKQDPQWEAILQRQRHISKLCNPAPFVGHAHY